jgi:hypothetical protein
MPDLLDCLMPACHQASAITTPAVAGVTFPTLSLGRPDSLLLCLRTGL